MSITITKSLRRIAARHSWPESEPPALKAAAMHIAPFRLERYFARYEFTAPYLLCASDCEAVSVDDVLQLDPTAVDRLHTLRLGYVEAAGTPALRSAVAKLYESVAEDDILLHAGSSEAIFSFMHCMLQPGDHVIVHSPCYESHATVAQSIGCEVTRWVGDERQGWSLDVEFLASALRPTTKVVIVTVPHNPTGYLMAASLQASMVELLRQRGIWLFSDEIFRFLERDESQRPPAAVDVYERAVSVGGISKSFGLPGLRVGWVVTRDRALRDAMASFKDYLSLCNGAVDELLACIAVEHHSTLHARNRAIIEQNLQLFDAFVKRHADRFTWHPPQGGSIALVRYAGNEGTQSLCRELVTHYGVLLLPSCELEFGDQHFRVGLGRRNGPACIERLEQAVREMTFV